MSVESNDGGLGWKARIDTSELERDAQRMADIITDASKKTEESQKKLFKSISGSSRASIQDGAEALKNLTPEMQKQVAIIQSFQIELAKVKTAQRELDQGLKKGTVSQKEYNQATQGLTVRYAEINENIRTYSDRLNTLAQIENTSATSVNRYKMELASLQKQYDAMSESQRANASTGGVLASKIIDLTEKIELSKQATKKQKEEYVAATGSIDFFNQKIRDLTIEYGKLNEAQRNDPKVGLQIQKEIAGYEKKIGAIQKSNATIRENIAIENAASGSIDQKRLKLQQLINSFNSLSKSERENGQNTKNLVKEIRALDTEISKASRSLKGMNESSAVLNRVMVAAAGLFTIASAKNFVNDIIRVRGEIEQLGVAFSTILGSKERANVLFKEIVQVATTTPFTLTEVADGAKQLLAYGFAAEEVRTELLKIGNVASGTGSTFQEVAYAYGTLKTQGRAFARDIRQFTTRGIPIVAELAKQFGVTEERVNELVSAGKVGFPEVSKAFQSLTSEGGVFFNLMEEQSQTVTGLVARLQDKFQLMLNSIGESNEGILKSGITGLIELVDNYEKVAEILGSLIVVYGSYRAALLLTNAASLLVTSGTTGMTAAQALNATTAAIATRATALWGAAMSALPLVAVTALIAGLVGIVYSWNQAVDSATASQQRLNDIQKEGESRVESEKSKIQDLITILKSEIATKEQKEGAMRGIQGILGDYIDGYTQEEIAAGKAEKAITDYTDALRKSVEIKEAFDQYNKLGDAIQEIEKKGVKALNAYEQVGQNLKNVFSLNGRSMGQYFKELFFVDDEELIRRNIESLKEQREALKETFDFTDILSGTTGTGPIRREFDNLIGDVQGNFDRLVQLAENKADLDKIRQGLTEFLEELAPNDPQIDGIKRQIQKVNEVLKSYAITQENKSLSDAARERKKILDQLNKMEAETFVKGFDKRQQEIEKVKLQFQELRDAAKQAGLGAGVQERIDRLEERRTGDITYRSETDLLKTELEKRKSLYQDYEMFAKDFGIQAAEERYSKELDLAKSYLDLIQQEYDKLSESRPEDRTGAQNERLEFLEKELEAEKRVQQKKYDDFLKTLQDYETQRAQITERYQLERQRLIESGDTQYLNQLTENYNTEIGELDDANARKLGLYRQFFRGLDTLSVSASKKLISDLRGSLELLRSQGRITESFYRDMLDRLNQAELQTNMRIPNGLKSIAQEFSNISNEIGGVNKGLGVMFGILGNSLNRVADIKANIAQFDLASKANGGKGDFFGMASAGLGIFGAGISIAQTIAGVVKSSLDKQLEVQKKQLEFQRKILFGELEISRIQRERALEQAEVNGNTLATLKEQRSVVEDNYNRIADDINKIEEVFGKDIQKNVLDDINRYYGFYKSERDKKLAELANSLYIDGTKTVSGGLFGLGKETINIYKSLAGLTFDQIENLSLKGQLTEEAEKLFQELKKLKEEGADLEQQLKDIEDQMKAIFTGNASALGIADTIIEGFKQGKRAVEDFGDDIEEILRNAILSGFKYRFLEAPLNALLEQLYQDAVSNDELSASEIANFQDQFGKIVEEYSKVFEDLQAATGIDLSGINNQNQRGLAGAIRREMTEATAGELAGLFRGNFDINKRHFQVAQDSLQVQIAIERNTFETVQELKSLIRINQDIRSSLSTQSSRDLGLNE